MHPPSAFARSTLPKMPALRSVRLEKVAVVCFPQLIQAQVNQAGDRQPVAADRSDLVVSYVAGHGSLEIGPAFPGNCYDERAGLFSKKGNVGSSSALTRYLALEFAICVLDTDAAS